ncbi:MAG: MmcQ/YjbR family DNA-binding protein [Chitinophagaceae bacterium]|nr:MmcQ/YjbR family DNA-binding protein [Chitinophagaceae bacterium]
MISIDNARKFALTCPEAEERSHFARPDFRVKNKVFATLHTDKNLMVVKLTPLDQSVFCAFDNTIIYPVTGGWGTKGWTFVNLKKIRKEMFDDIVTTAWKTVATPALRKKYFPE